MTQEITCLERVVLAFRGDLDGSYKGAHVEYFTRVLRDDGSEVARQQGRSTTISEVAAQGFTWPDVAASINAGLLLSSETQAAQIAVLKGEKAAVDSDLLASNGQVSLLRAEVESLKAQLVEYQTQADERGVPKEVTMRQAQLALLGAGLLDLVEEAIAKIPGDEGRAARITWNKASTVVRNDPLIAQLQGVLKLTDLDVDNLFIAARKL